MAFHNELGKRGEEEAMNALLLKGYIIRETYWRCGKLEVDIIAEKNRRIIMVEVKTRSENVADLKEVITKKKMTNLIQAGKAYIEANRLPFELQFDIILQIGNPDNFKTEHIEAAFRPRLRTYR